MPKLSVREAELRYLNKTRSIRARRKKRTRSKERTPWKNFFSQGIGAEVETEIPRASIHSIVYTYGKKLGKRFECSYSEGKSDNTTLVKIEAVGIRDE